MGAQYGQRLPRLTCQKRANAGDSIHRQPGKECEKQVSGTVFNQHQKAVSVVIVRFPRIRFRQRTASQMIDYALRLNSAAVSRLLSTPAEKIGRASCRERVKTWEGDTAVERMAS